MMNFFKNYTLLHIGAEHSDHGGLAEFLSDNLGKFGEFLDEVLLHSFIDAFKLVLFLFITYLIIGFIEHKTADNATSFMKRAGVFGPFVGGAFGAIPQCGFSSAAANLYTGRVISMGTIIAVFLSTSDEMLPVMLAGNVKIGTVLLIIAYKCAVGILVGMIIDLLLKTKKLDGEEENRESVFVGSCQCGCGILGSAVRHTVSVSIFVFIVTLVVNALVFFIGDGLADGITNIPVISHLLCAIVGLVPNCAVSVALTRLAMSGFITSGAMISGLLSGAGVGLLVLFKVNKKHFKENLAIVLILIGAGVLFGLLAEALPFLSLK